ncbi:MAG: energy-coupled thiamine transporter ThiT [Caldisericia bacterium]
MGAVAFGSLGRFLFHFISGVVFFSQFAPEGFSIAGYVALYIFTHLFFEAFVCLIVIAPIQRSSNLMEYQESDKVSV